MSAIKVTYALLSGAAAVTALVPADRICPVFLPQGKTMPAIVFEPISAIRPGAIDAYAPTHLTRARVQINLIAVDYAGVLQLLEAVKPAMQFQRGVIAGVTVHSVLHAGEGPAVYDQQLGLVSQAIDFFITHEAT